MTRNMSILDRSLRTFFGLALVLMSWPFLDVVPGTVLSYFCLIFGIVNVISSLICWCFMYDLLGVSTKDDG